jgi:ornithine carbamoyltransferase
MLEHTPSGDIADVSYCYLGDARNNVGNSLLVTGALLGIDVRIGAPDALQPSAEVRALAESLAAASGARLTVSDDLNAVLPGAGFVHTDVWVSMGEPVQAWDDRVAILGSYRVDADVMKRTGRPDSKFMHCLPALHDMSTAVGRQIGERTGLTDGIEVAHEVFESPASIVFDQAENRMHTIKALLVATIA